MVKINNSETHRWRFIPLDDGTFRITNEHLGDQRFLNLFSTGNRARTSLITVESIEHFTDWKRSEKMISDGRMHAVSSNWIFSVN